jgi:hypothetical protein
LTSGILPSHLLELVFEQGRYHSKPNTGLVGAQPRTLQVSRHPEGGIDAGWASEPTIEPIQVMRGGSGPVPGAN